MGNETEIVPLRKNKLQKRKLGGIFKKKQTEIFIELVMKIRKTMLT